MINPYILPKLPEDKQYALIFGYVIDVKDRGGVNMLLFKQDTMDPSSKLISIAAWGLEEGQQGTDMRQMTMDCKGRFAFCLVMIRPKEKDGKLYTNYDLKYIVKAPLQTRSA